MGRKLKGESENRDDVPVLHAAQVRFLERGPHPGQLDVWEAL